MVAGGRRVKTTENKIHWPRCYQCLINCVVNDYISVFSPPRFFIYVLLYADVDRSENSKKIKETIGPLDL